MDLSNISPSELERLINSGELSGDDIDSLKLSRPIAPAVEFSPEQSSVDVEKEELSATNESAINSLETRDIQTSASTPFQFKPIEPTATQGYAFDNPVEMLMMLDDDVSSGTIQLHPWQIQIMLDFAAKCKGLDPEVQRNGWNQESPFCALVRACNGSGKDKYVVAPCAVWLCMVYMQARCVITSSSGFQLDNQTDVYINGLCLSANKKFGRTVWKCNYRYYECLDTGSPMALFATDEPGKAEGFHPIAFGKKLALFESEAKTVPDEIHNAQSRCSGYTHRVLVSTPGVSSGHMFEIDSTAIDRKMLEDWSTLRGLNYIKYHVTAYDCSHIPKTVLEYDKVNLPGGETGFQFRSQYLAEFGTTDELVVVSGTYVWQCAKVPVRGGWLKKAHNDAGIDLSDGGDETVLVIRNGNKLVAVIAFRFDNTEDTIDYLDKTMREYGLNHPDSLIWGDAGGLGKPILNRLQRMGWHNIRFVLNQSEPTDKRVYANRGTENWFNAGKLIERHEVILTDRFNKEDRLLIKQLSTRYYKISNKNKHQLLSKPEQKSKGYPSPDRADAFVLAFSDYKSTFEPKTTETKSYKPPLETPKAEKPTTDFTVKESLEHSRGSNNFWQQFNYSRNRDTTLLKEELALINQQRRANNEQEQQS